MFVRYKNRIVNLEQVAVFEYFPGANEIVFYALGPNGEYVQLLQYRGKDKKAVQEKLDEILTGIKSWNKLVTLDLTDAAETLPPLEK